MGLSELLGGFAGENGRKHPLMHAFPQVRNIRHEIIPRKPPRSSGVTSNLGPFFCKRAQKMGGAAPTSQTTNSERRKWAPDETRARLETLPAPLTHRAAGCAPRRHRGSAESAQQTVADRRSHQGDPPHRRCRTANSPAIGEHGRAVRLPEGAEPGPNRKLANEDREALVRFGARRHREAARGIGGDAIGGSLAPSSPAANMPSSKPRRPAPRRAARPAHRASSPLLPTHSPAAFVCGDNLLSGLPITRYSEALILWCRR